MGIEVKAEGKHNKGCLALTECSACSEALCRKVLPTSSERGTLPLITSLTEKTDTLKGLGNLAKVTQFVKTRIHNQSSPSNICTLYSLPPELI